MIDVARIVVIWAVSWIVVSLLETHDGADEKSV